MQSISNNRRSGEANFPNLSREDAEKDEEDEYDEDDNIKERERRGR